MKSFDSLIGPAARAAMRDDRRIRGVISRIVPAEALAHVVFCRVAGRQLRVTLDSAAWVPALRFDERRLLAELARDGLDVRTVSWHVAPAANPGPREPSGRTAATASARAGRAVLSAADALDGDDALARAMRRMARHLTGASGGKRPDGGAGSDGGGGDGDGPADGRHARRHATRDGPAETPVEDERENDAPEK